MSIRLGCGVKCLWASALEWSGDGFVAYLCQCILLFWRKVGISEKKSVVLEYGQGTAGQEETFDRLPRREAVRFLQTLRVTDSLDPRQ